MDELVRRMALRLKLRKISGTVVHHVAILKRDLDNQGFKTRMIKGYCVIESTKEACDHYWIREETTGLDIDIAFQVACLKTPELMALRPVLLEVLPKDLIRSDAEENLIRAENNRLYELFQADPKGFWREAPRDVVAFHVK